jgi:threonine aldolase
MPSVTDLRPAQLFDEVKCDILTTNQEADDALKLEEVSGSFL